MPMRRTIGISLACLVTSACTIAETPEESTTHSGKRRNAIRPGGWRARAFRARSRRL
jgi:hypothetical protein